MINCDCGKLSWGEATSFGSICFYLAPKPKNYKMFKKIQRKHFKAKKVATKDLQ